MKKTLIASSLIIATITPGFAYTQHNIESANFIAKKWVINNNSSNPVAYNLDNKITRREMLKVMMKLSGKSVTEGCVGKFTDVGSSDWGCKYAEAALKEWFISANKTFRPADNVTQIEALKMIMQAKGLQRDENNDWRAGYVSKAKSAGILDSGYLDYNKTALRGWIFSSSAKSYSDFDYVAPETNLDPEIEALFKELLGE